MAPPNRTPAPSGSSPESLQAADMQRERDSSALSSDALSILFAGSLAARDRSRWLMGLLEQDQSGAFDRTRLHFMSRKERFMKGQQTAVRYVEIRNREGLQKEDRDRLRLFTDVYLSVQVHESMGHPTLQNQSSEAQWAEWAPMVESARWIVGYAQTELAHGSHIGALRTTATLDKTTDEWVVHTPEPSAGKTWIGGTGLSATHAIVMANMITGSHSNGDYKEHGMHPFLVQLRSLETHELLPGREALDMGPKWGVPSMDNGYLTFDAVRIPRTNLLARFQSVDQQGAYRQHNASAKQLMRGTMTLVRVGLVEIAALHLARGALLATRYACVRRQGSGRSRDEPQIIDYASVQQRILTSTASAWALTIASRHLRGLYTRMMTELRANGASELLPIVHGLTSTLKPVATNISLEGIDRCRRSMGGHGYSAAAGFEFSRDQPTAGLTYEGQNEMLLLGPAANFLVKQYRAQQDREKAPKKRPSQILPELAFLSARFPRRFEGSSMQDFQNGGAQVQIVGYVVWRLVRELSKLRSESDGSSSMTPTQRAHLDASLSTRASNAYGLFLILYSFDAWLRELHNASSPAREALALPNALPSQHLSALERLRDVFALEICILAPAQLAELVGSGYLSSTQVRHARLASADALAALRPEALVLSEAVDLPDTYLAAPLAARDGRAYERFVEWMRSEPLNQSGEHGGRDEMGVVKGYKEGLGRLVRGAVGLFDGEKDARRAKL